MRLHGARPLDERTHHGDVTMKTADTQLDVRVGSILFTDLVGFTEYNDAVGDAAALAVLDAQTVILTDLLDERVDSRLVKELGDGLMVWFASAGDAVGCAIEFLTAINEARRANTFPLSVRLGMHHGEAVARGHDLVGQTVNIAARVTDLAGPNELLVSEEVLQACEPRSPEVRLQAVGPASVRGVNDPIWLHRYGS